MDVHPITRWALICHHCGAPMEALISDDGLTAILVFETREQAVKAAIEAWDEDNQHPAVAQVIIKGV